MDSLAWPDRFFPFFVVAAEKYTRPFSAATKKNGKNRSGQARLGPASLLAVSNFLTHETMHLLTEYREFNHVLAIASMFHLHPATASYVATYT